MSYSDFSLLNIRTSELLPFPSFYSSVFVVAFPYVVFMV